MCVYIYIYIQRSISARQRKQSRRHAGRTRSLFAYYYLLYNIYDILYRLLAAWIGFAQPKRLLHPAVASHARLVIEGLVFH